MDIINQQKQRIGGILSKPLLRKWWFWVGVVVVLGVLSNLAGKKGGGGSFKDKFFSDSTNFTTWVRNTGYEKHSARSITLRRDSTFTITDYVDGYGDIELTGRYKVDGVYDFKEKMPGLYKELDWQYRKPEMGKYMRLLVEWDQKISSYHVMGNPILGVPLSLKKPGYAGSRNYRSYSDYILLDRSDDGDTVHIIGLVYYSAPEGGGTGSFHDVWFDRK